MYTLKAQISILYFWTLFFSTLWLLLGRMREFKMESSYSCDFRGLYLLRNSKVIYQQNLSTSDLSTDVISILFILETSGVLCRGNFMKVNPAMESKPTYQFFKEKGRSLGVKLNQFHLMDYPSIKLYFVTECNQLINCSFLCHVRPFLITQMLAAIWNYFRLLDNGLH